MEHGWLIETKFDGDPAWLSEVRGRVTGYTFTRDPSEAMRFARERDAKAVIAQFGQPGMDAIEHQWE